MDDSLAAVVLAAGAGTRLAPLTGILPKPLCPVANVALVDHALAAVAPVTASVAVNVHHGRDAIEAHLAGRAHLSIEPGEALGTAGALGHLRGWIAGRGVLVVNADTWHRADLAEFAAGWDGERVRLLVAGDASRGLTPGAGVVASLMPWSEVRDLVPEPTGLYEVSWQRRARDGSLDLAGYDGPFVACDRPTDYLRANLTASGGASVIGPGAVVQGRVERSVVWPGGIVREAETLIDAIRAGDHVTVLCR